MSSLDDYTKAITIKGLHDCLGGYKNFRGSFLIFKISNTLNIYKMFKNQTHLF